MERRKPGKKYTENLDAPYLTVRAVSNALDVSKGTVYRWLTAGKLKGVTFGGQTRIAQADFQRFLKPYKPLKERDSVD